MHPSLFISAERIEISTFIRWNKIKQHEHHSFALGLIESDAEFMKFAVDEVRRNRPFTVSPRGWGFMAMLIIKSNWAESALFGSWRSWSKCDIEFVEIHEIDAKINRRSEDKREVDTLYSPRWSEVIGVQMTEDCRPYGCLKKEEARTMSRPFFAARSRRIRAHGLFPTKNSFVLKKFWTLKMIECRQLGLSRFQKNTDSFQNIRISRSWLSSERNRKSQISAPFRRIERDCHRRILRNADSRSDSERPWHGDVSGTTIRFSAGQRSGASIQTLSAVVQAWVARIRIGRRMAADVAWFEPDGLLDVGRSGGQGCRSEREKFGSSAPSRSGRMGQNADENRACRNRFVAWSNSTMHSKTRRTFWEVTVFFDAECNVSVKLVKFISAFVVIL